jgi:hypothetical protein
VNWESTPKAGINPPNGNWNIEWIVTPPAFNAAIPVEPLRPFLWVVMISFKEWSFPYLPFRLEKQSVGFGW